MSLPSIVFELRVEDLIESANWTKNYKSDKKKRGYTKLYLKLHQNYLRIYDEVTHRSKN